MLKFTRKKIYIILAVIIIAITTVACLWTGKQKKELKSGQTGVLMAQMKNLKGLEEAINERNVGEETEFQTEAETTEQESAQIELPAETKPLTDEETEPLTEIKTEVSSEIKTEPKTEQPSQGLYIPKIKNTSEYLIAIDAGHQAQGNYEKEPIGPGASETKNKVAGGTSGVTSGIPEYELTLAVALKLKSVLLERGYQVFMIRESNQVNISNAERAIMANNAGADVFIRIHADASESGNANGMTALCQTPDNPYNGMLYSYSRHLSDCLLDAMAVQTGARKRGVTETDTMSGINWAQVPTAIIEMGFMTNAEEDRLMSTEDYQNRLALGMADGIENYLAGLGQ